MSESTEASGRTVPTFRLTCWALGGIAFVQLLMAGVALAVRMENAREVRVEEKIVTKVVTVPAAPAKAGKPSKPVVALPPPPPVPAEVPLPPARPLDAPEIADPVVERLVNEAREARVAEDMGTAINKLDEALARDPKEPNALYERGLVLETMAAYDESLVDPAAEAYQRVFALGTSGAGALYPLAAKKLRDGIERPADMRGKLSLGRVRIFPDKAHANGERVVLTVPVHAAPGSEPKNDDFRVMVHFFDKTPQGDILPAVHEVNRTTAESVRWVSGDIDWLGGEELMRMEYILPERSASDVELFGHRKYYGQVVELYYKNELVDTQPWPRHLASHVTGAQPPETGMDPLFMEGDFHFDPGTGVLPPLEDELPTFPDER